MLRRWMIDVASAREVAGEVRAYLVGIANRIDERGWLRISAHDALDEAKKVGRHPVDIQFVGDTFDCPCGKSHKLREVIINCGCGAHYQVEWSDEGPRVVVAS